MANLLGLRFRTGACSGRGLGRRVVNLTGKAWPALIKTGTREATAVSSTAALSVVGQLEAGLGSSVDFSRSVSLAGVFPQPLERRRTLPLSEKCELTLVWGARHLLANSHPQCWTLRDGKWRIAAAAATRGTTTARGPQTWPPRGGGKHPTPAPATTSTPRAGLGRGGPTFIPPSLACGSPHSGLGIVEPRRGRRWGMETTGRGLLSSD